MKKKEILELIESLKKVYINHLSSGNTVIALGVRKEIEEWDRKILKPLPEK